MLCLPWVTVENPGKVVYNSIVDGLHSVFFTSRLTIKLRRISGETDFKHTNGRKKKKWWIIHIKNDWVWQRQTTMLVNLYFEWKHSNSWFRGID